LNKKSIKNDWSLWLLLALNLYAIFHYMQHPESINTLMAIFWIQSAFIGLFTFIGMLAFTNRTNSGFTTTEKPGIGGAGCSAMFFAVHYGGFHLAYFFFVTYKLAGDKHADWQFIQLSFWAILFGSIMQFIQDKRHNHTAAVNPLTMFIMPYARIVPMHLAILLPSFLHVKVGIVFLGLKVLADVIMHMVYRNLLFSSPTKNNAIISGD
jgi:hypothetical protein